MDSAVSDIGLATSLRHSVLDTHDDVAVGSLPVFM